jgi:leader peptidase (prepilin peptidase)/N-methyltransferase
MYLVKILGDWLFKKESLGGGDIKLAFLMGLTLGYPGIGLRLSLISLIFSAFLALPYAIGTLYLNKKNELPYGPFLISSMVIVYVFINKFSRLLILFTL